MRDGCCSATNVSAAEFRGGAVARGLPGELEQAIFGLSGWRLSLTLFRARARRNHGSRQDNRTRYPHDTQDRP